MFQALLLNKDDAGFRAEVTTLDDAALKAATPDADVLVAVEASTLNYKDGLAITNRGPVVRRWPMVPGIDGAGTVVESRHARWKAGDKVVLNGFGVGETHWGCLAERAHLKGDWLVRLPEGFTPRDAMAIGTAGYTAMLCLMALQRHGVKPAAGDVLVTGATGGVGSVVVSLLKQAGYRVVASTGKAAEAAYLRELGAADVIDRNELSAPGKPFQKERWAAAVDTLGSHTLANVCAQMRYGGAVAACGLAQGADLPLSVMPFILRGVALLGVDSVMAPLALREEAWSRLARELPRAALAAIQHEIGLGEAIAKAQELIDGKVRGRIVVRTA
ncbi:MAG: oxidoreductase [Burkholderiaceae bacterium]|nr:oxidoreductase [Burkholderiaceae bacterium]